MTANNSPFDFDPAKLALPQDFAASVGVRKVLTTVPVRKPNRQEFVRVHPDESYRLSTAVIELKDERETYLVAPDLFPELPQEIVPKLLATAITRQGVLFLWPARLPNADGRPDPWNTSAIAAMDHAIKRWVRVTANMSLGAYELAEATAKLPEPEWPDEPFAKLLEIAFRDRVIESLDHPVLQRLRGEI